MPENPKHALAAMVRQLSLREELNQADRDAILELPFTLRRVQANQYLVWDGDRPQHTCLLISGFAYRHKLAGNGGRQIVSIHMRGDIVDLQNSLLGTADHNVQMLTNGDVALIPVEAMRDLAFRHPSVGMAMWYETLVEGSIFREWVLNIGRRDARTRIAHLLCELALRMESAGLGEHINYELPISQEQLGDAVALTSVHVNRTLMKLEQEGLIVRTRRMITVVDWKKMIERGRFRAALSTSERACRPGRASTGRRQDSIVDSCCRFANCCGSPASAKYRSAIDLCTDAATSLGALSAAAASSAARRRK
jgi:CRP-like cAMP-binding protein